MSEPTFETLFPSLPVEVACGQDPNADLRAAFERAQRSGYQENGELAVLAHLLQEADQ